MECKDEYARRMHYRIRIKVEPYWNVKKFDSDTNKYTAKIKVEPYWNVKIDALMETVKEIPLK